MIDPYIKLQDKLVQQEHLERSVLQIKFKLLTLFDFLNSKLFSVLDSFTRRMLIV
jgi:hypothetical protein